MATKPSKSNITFILILGLVLVVLGIRYYQQSQGGLSSDALANERKKGNPQAETKIIEFIDFQCPACAQGVRILSQFLEDNPDLVEVELKYFPLSGHAHGYLSAYYAECAARQGLFWPMHDMLIKYQDQWSRLNDAEPAFSMYAQEVGLDENKLQACLESSETVAYVNKTKQEGASLGIRSTPSYVIDNELVVGTKNLSRELDNIVAAANPAPDTP